VLLVYHSAGAAVRAAAKHPVPKRALVDFARFSLEAGESAHWDVAVSAGEEAWCQLVDEKGEQRHYAGNQSLVVSRNTGEGLADDQTFTITCS
jgi:hypothetical protein